MWYNKYIGIPYQEKGRDTTGADCWGLTRLIYKNEYDITLPSFSQNYEHSDTERIAELFAQYKEGWVTQDTPIEGSIVLFRILGHVSHVGIMINSTQFIHTRDGQSAVIDSLEKPRWRNRISGFYTYSENTTATMEKPPSSFKAIVANREPGMNLGEILKSVLEEHKIPVTLESKVLIFIDGEAVSVIDNSNLVPKLGQTIEYRIIPGKDALKVIAIVALAYFAPMIATAMLEAGTAAGIAGLGTTAMVGGVSVFTAGAGALFATTMVVSLIGSALINAIFPVRPPEAIPDAGSANAQLMLTGSRNSANLYAPIPVVLGRYRLVANCAAINYLEVDTDTAYLRMLLTWGYGPLDIEDIFVGSVPLANYDSYTSAIVKGLSTENQASIDAVYKIYGPDTFQVSPNLPLTYDEGTPVDHNKDWVYVTIPTLCNNVKATLHFPEGLRGIYREGDNAGKVFSVTFTGEAQIIEVSQDSLTEIGSWAAIPALMYGGSGTTHTEYVTQYTDLYEGSYQQVAVQVPDNNAQSFYQRKDAFSVSFAFPTSPTPKYYKIRVRRTNRQSAAQALELDNASGKPLYFHKAVLYLVTGTNPEKKAVKPPKNTKLSLMALNIKATDQISGSIEGINALVTSRCLDYVGGAWVEAATRNPASLFRYMLQHPGNAQKVLDVEVSSKIDLLALQDWHAYCVTNSFTYDAVVTAQRSMLEVLRDICAAGRASPVLIGGKWSIVIDRPRSAVVQHFTPHNSWGFEATKKLSQIPHGLRVVFINAAKDYQSEELIVYNLEDGYSEENSSLFEAVQLPGVTNASAVYKHARFHFAQARLRPETYSINADMEYIVCTRGDLVRVAHDIPEWGSGTGRIKSFINTTTIEIDEPILLEPSKTYRIRIRTANNGSVLRDVVSIFTQGYYSTIVLTTAITSIEGAAGNLVMLGLPNLESVELVVISVEPSSNLTAKLTLVDYSPGVYTSDTLPIPAFDTKITRPSIFARNSIKSIPNVQTLSIRSDESVMELSGSSYVYKINIPFNNPANLENNITDVEARLCLELDTSSSWRMSESVLLSAGSVTFSDVTEGSSYSVQLRYTSGLGYVGPWSDEVTHTIVGKTNPPAKVISAITVVPEGDKLRLTWPKNTEIDLAGYEVRDVEAVWGSSTGVLFIGNSNTCLVSPGPAGVSKTWYIRAYDGTNLYSLSSATKSFTVVAPAAPTNITTTYTGITALFKWNASVAGSFAVRNYLLTLTGIGLTTITATVDSTEWELPVTWSNAVTITITPIDVCNNTYTGSTNTSVLALGVPSTPAVPVLSVSGTDLVLDWADNAVSSNQLTLLNYEIYNSDSTLAWKGIVSKANISMLGLSGNRTYTLIAKDYKNQVSLTRSISYDIPTPTNIANNSTFISSFGTSLTDASLTISWSPVTSIYGVSGYEVSYNGTSVITSSNTITLSPLPAGWVGDKVFTIRTIDLIGNMSSGVSKTITKSKPDIVIGVTADIIDNNVMLYWALPARTTLPIDHVIVRKTKINGVAVTPINVGEKSGTFTTIFEREANTYTYEIAAVDTDKQEGPAFSLTVTVSQPPDFIFNGSATSTFNGIASNAKVEINLSTGINQVTMPIDTVSTVSQHFDSRGWTTPQNQIDALYPIYSQPSVASGYYEETVDFGTIIGSSQVTLTTTGTVLAGNPIVVTSLSYSSDNITFSAPSTSTLLFVSSFRYVKINVAVSQISSDKAIYALNYINIRLDSKIKDDAGSVVCADGTTHPEGTLVNFKREFIDVTSITVSPNSTTPIIPVYDYKDTVISATYNITSNVCTVTTSSPHGFSNAIGATGQKVRLEFTSGYGVSGIYVLTYISSTQYSVAMTAANTSGNVSTYSQSMRVYLYNTAGARISGTASWAIKGY